MLLDSCRAFFELQLNPTTLPTLSSKAKSLAQFIASSHSQLSTESLLSLSSHLLPCLSALNHHHFLSQVFLSHSSSPLLSSLLLQSASYSSSMETNLHQYLLDLSNTTPATLLTCLSKLCLNQSLLDSMINNQFLNPLLVDLIVGLFRDDFISYFKVELSEFFTVFSKYLLVSNVFDLNLIFDGQPAVHSVFGFLAKLIELIDLDCTQSKLLNISERYLKYLETLNFRQILDTECIIFNFANSLKILQFCRDNKLESKVVSLCCDFLFLVNEKLGVSDACHLHILLRSLFNVIKSHSNFQSNVQSNHISLLDRSFSLLLGQFNSVFSQSNIRFKSFELPLAFIDIQSKINSKNPTKFIEIITYCVSNWENLICTSSKISKKYLSIISVILFKLSLNLYLFDYSDCHSVKIFLLSKILGLISSSLPVDPNSSMSLLPCLLVFLVLNKESFLIELTHIQFDLQFIWLWLGVLVAESRNFYSKCQFELKHEELKLLQFLKLGFDTIKKDHVQVFNFETTWICQITNIFRSKSLNLSRICLTLLSLYVPSFSLQLLPESQQKELIDGIGEYKPNFNCLIESLIDDEFNLSRYQISFARCSYFNLLFFSSYCISQLRCNFYSELLFQSLDSLICLTKSLDVGIGSIIISKFLRTLVDQGICFNNVLKIVIQGILNYPSEPIKFSIISELFRILKIEFAFELNQLTSINLLLKFKESLLRSTTFSIDSVDYGLPISSSIRTDLITIIDSLVSNFNSKFLALFLENSTSFSPKYSKIFDYLIRIHHHESNLLHSSSSFIFNNYFSSKFLPTWFGHLARNLTESRLVNRILTLEDQNLDLNELQCFFQEFSSFFCCFSRNILTIFTKMVCLNLFLSLKNAVFPIISYLSRQLLSSIREDSENFHYSPVEMSNFDALHTNSSTFKYLEYLIYFDFLINFIENFANTNFHSLLPLIIGYSKYIFYLPCPEVSLYYIFLLTRLNYFFLKSNLFLAADSSTEAVFLGVSKLLVYYRADLSRPIIMIDLCVYLCKLLQEFLRHPENQSNIIESPRVKTPDSRQSISQSIFQSQTKSKALERYLELFMSHLLSLTGKAPEFTPKTHQNFKDFISLSVNVNPLLPLIYLDLNQTSNAKTEVFNFLLEQSTYLCHLLAVSFDYLLFVLENVPLCPSTKSNYLVDALNKSIFVFGRVNEMTYFVRIVSCFVTLFSNHNWQPFIVDCCSNWLHLSLSTVDSKALVCYLPQIIQFILKFSSYNSIVDPFMSVIGQHCKSNSLFLLRLLFLLRSIGAPVLDNFHLNINSKVNSQPIILLKSLLSNLDPYLFSQSYSQMLFIDSFTLISMELKSVPKPERKNALIKRLKSLPLSQQKGILPKGEIVNSVLPEKCVVLKSHAKVPILLTFTTETDSTVSYIFKAGDDVRQDSLAIQLIHQISNILKCSGLDLFLLPYLALPTSSDDGIIEVVPESRSRDQIGGDSDGGLIDWFLSRFGDRKSESFCCAQSNFIKSMAGYSLATFILAVKDRHNGNLLFDSKGNIIHIDFGFIFDISPGGDFKFESAPFKLSREMFDLMGGSVSAKPFEKFVSLVVRGYLALRKHSNLIISLVNLMLSANLGCFKKDQTIDFLKDRLSYNLSDNEAVVKMLNYIKESNCNYRTAIYDEFQSWQNNISKPPLLYDIGWSRSRSK
ncbi:hypothetical protein P9112_011526 [Eukaryota sp. TZLM1-RC]